jgi:hypothetical protein
VSVRAIYLTLVLSALVAGCSVMPASARRAMAVPYKPTNVSVRQDRMPESIRRVAVLPVPHRRDDANQASGANLLEPVLIAELHKRNVFEVVPISPDALQELTGRRERCRTRRCCFKRIV